MDFGIILPTITSGANGAAIEAAAATANRLGWSAAWTTDHVLVDHASAAEYGCTFEALTSLAYVAAANPRLSLGVSVIVVPQRNAVVLAKELATLDALTHGRVIAGVGVGWNRAEFANLGEEERFGRRGAFLDETIALWRTLWSGSGEPFDGTFHRVDDYVFEPLPAMRDRLPIWVGGRSAAALGRAGRLGDGYHATAAGPADFLDRVSIVRAAAAEAGRPEPVISSRVRVQFGTWQGDGYRMAGEPAAMAEDVGAFASNGVSHLALWFGETDAGRLVELMERFDAEVIAACGA